MNDDLRELVSEYYARELAARVVEKLRQKRRHLFVLYTGARLGFEEAMASMEKLAMAGYTFDVLYSDSASRVIDLPRVKRTLNPTQIIPAAEHNKEGFITSNPFAPLVVPALTVRTTAHIASLASDTEAAKIIQNSLMHGRDVVVSADGSCPDCWKANNLPITPAMAEQMSKNLKQLEGYGAVLANARGLHRAVMRMNGEPVGEAAASQEAAQAKATAQTPPSAEASKPAAQSKPAPQNRRKPSGIVSMQDIITMQPGSTLVVGEGCQITQLAKDTAATRMVTIRKE